MYALMIAAAAVLSTPAFAMFEVKGHYDVLTATPSGFNTQMEDYVQGAPDVTGVTGYGADATFKFPVLPIVVGLRYDTLARQENRPRPHQRHGGQHHFGTHRHPHRAAGRVGV